MSALIEEILSLPWTDTFTSNALAKARAYALEDRVEILEVNDRQITAFCVGSSQTAYEQTLSIARHRGGDGLRCYCSCPVGFDCKHCAAVLYCLDMNVREASGQEVTVELGRSLEHWLSTIPVAVQPAEEKTSQAASTRLFYQLRDLPVAGKWQLDIFKVYQLKNGELRDVKPLYSLSDLLMRQPGYLSEQDLRIARLLVAMHSHHAYYSGYPLEGSSGAELLEMLLRTSRLFLDFQTLQPLTAGVSRSAQFAWAEQADGSYRPQWTSAEAPVENVLALEPLYYLDREQRQIGLLLNDLDEKLACHLALAPEIPAHQALQFSHRMSAATKVAPPHKLTERIVADVAPQGYLILVSGQRYARWQYEPEHRAALLFTYDGHPAQDRNPEVMTLSGAETQRIQRQPAAEKALRQQLQKHGFKKASRKSSIDLPGEMFTLADDSAWLTFAQQGIPVLRDAGWEVDVSSDFHFNVEPVEDWYAEIEEDAGRQWFDLQLGIVVNGERHSLLPILLHLLRSQPQLLDPVSLAERGDDELLLVELRGGRIDAADGGKVALPYGRVKPLMATLSELYLGGRRVESLRLTPPDAARLRLLDGVPLTWQGGERLRSFAQRLRESTYTPVAAPAGLNAQLRPYQLEGLNWMQTLRELGMGGILGDDMGLGKTLQTLAHLLTEKQAGRLEQPALAVMPTSLIPNWLDEAQRFTPQLKVLALHGSARQKDFASLSEYDLVLTTYALLPRDLEVLQPQPWSVLILDEAQNIKNPVSKAAQAARDLQASQRLCLSGTPLENHLGELWSQFHFLMPGWLGDSKTFNRDYRTPIEKHGNAGRMQHLTARIKPFLLRRKKDQVATELPPKTEIVHWVELSDGQRDVYETVRVAMDKKVRDEIARSGVARSQIIILDALLKLRQVCCDLRLINTPLTAKALRSGSGKLVNLMEMLEELLGEGRRILLFSQFTSMLALIEQELQQRGIGYSLLTGDTTDRRTPVKDFQGGKVPLFLISLKAGGTGLNLTAADTVIHFDPWWNPAVKNQATDRAYRIGQNNPVFVYKLIARGTVEEKIQALQQEKAALAGAVLEGGTTGGFKLEQGDIEALFAPLPVPKG
ncbi:DEAD/DEAH box helicase [Pseudomonas granadensis]|uniref:DEAD/DEAH box helicase n=1 Tax=Pseudomonas granadensis TaxID=1421430 RepID=UPI0019D112E2|nr:DEAD/DEAH box helicase [Pseudomonas granadensis]MBN6776223.1 DEAD/DEAH box helicase [Pseudomonas granadensis]MBN6807241.1 DEAD/DEAH box helicase [Pseudomonas granadensis]MBN6834167.1 DEAD/DEAH box helicase [Pseudomonas granadensis]MBN6841616.1 DEAD/DEAH box helicase [Pseudomonas granadensis]MBN6870355.1 DEAD/DEAH box helicase [Pseudomonas granadensis]